jgi:PAS domain S-box-containing protein
MQKMLRLLIVEDCADDAELLIQSLLRAGVNPTWKRVETAEELHAALATGSWEAVVSDYSLPGFGAAAALEIVRESDTHLPFLIVSGTVGDEVAAAMVRAGANDYVLKQNLVRLAPALEREVREAGNRRTKRAAEQASAHLAAIVDSSDNAIVSRTLDGVLTSWNPAAAHLYGYTAAEALGCRNSLIIPADRLSEDAGIVKRLRQGGRTEYLDTDRRKKDSQLLHISAALSSIKDTTGKVTGISEITRDVSERQSFDEAILSLGGKENGRRRRRARTDLLILFIAIVVVFLSSFRFNLFEEVVQLILPHTDTVLDELVIVILFLITAFAMFCYRRWIEMRGSANMGKAPEMVLRALHDELEAQVRQRTTALLQSNKALREETEVRQRANEATRASEIRYRRLFEAAQDGILIVDPASRQILDVNPFLTKLLGYSRKDIVGKELWEIGLYQDIESNKEAFQSLKVQGYIRYDNRPLKTKDGLPIDVEFVSNTYDVGNSLVIQCNIRDNTARKRLEGELRLFRALIDQTKDKIEVIDPESGRFLDVNKRACIAYGYTHDEFLSLGFSDIDSVVAVRPWLDVVGELRLTSFATFESRHRRKDGSVFPVEININSIYLDREYFVAVVRDITARKHAENELRLSHKRLRDLIDGLGPSIFVGLLTPDGVFLDVNQPPLTAAGLKREDVLGKSFEKTPWWINSPATQQQLREAIVRAERGESSRFDLKMEVADSKVIDIDFSLQPMRDETGKVEFLVPSAVVITERKQAETALRASIEEFRTLAESVPLVIWITQPDGGTIYISKQWTDYTGLTQEESLGQGWIKSFHPEDQQRAWLAWQQTVATSSTFEIEVRLPRYDGVYRWWLIRGVPHRDGAGNILKWFGTCTDIDDLKQTEAGRIELLARLTLQIERMPLAYVLLDAHYRISDWNPAAESIFGYSKREALEMGPFDLISPTYRDDAENILERVRQGDLRADSVNDNVTKDGRTITCEWHNTPLFDLDGTFQGILSLAQDVTDKRKIAESLFASELRLKHVLASSPAILFTVDVADDRLGRITWISDNLQEILGYQPADAFTAEWWQGNIDSETRQEVSSRNNQVLFGLGYSTNEFRFRHRNGQHRWVLEEIRLIRDAKNRPVEAIGSWSDITARKGLEEQFRQAQKMEAFGQLAGGVAHDFNNLLTVIIGYSELMLRSLGRDDPSRKLLSEVHKAGERSAALTRQLLAFSRQQVLAPRVLNLNDVVSDTDKMLRRVIGEDIRLTTSLSSKLWAVRVDPGQIEQILLNLAVNARDAMPTGGKLTIETENVEPSDSRVQMHLEAIAGSQVLLSVTDTGTGMSPQVQSRIFEPFFTTKDVGKGTGLGLATVFGIVKQSGGHIDVQSEIGAGTTFKIFLPRAEQGLEDPEAPLLIEAPPRGTETILLVEDELAVRALTRHILVECGYSVLEAADGNEANRVAARHESPIHLLVTDVVMPGAGGRIVAESVGERFPDIRVLFMSGYTDDAVLRHGVHREGVNFLQKPFTPLSLAIKVREALDGPILITR